MSKIKELRKYYNAKGVHYIYVKQSDYTLEPISRNEVKVYFEPLFWDYYGTSTYTIKNDKISYSHAFNTFNKEQLFNGYNKDKIRDIIRDTFKPHIIKYIEEQKQKTQENNITDDFEDFEDFTDLNKNNNSQSNSTENKDSLDDFDFDFEAESNKLDELTADEFEFDDFISSPTLPASTVIEYFESLFETQIEPSNPILYYIEEASKKLKYLMRERELKQKIANKEKEIEELKSLLNENKKSIEWTDDIIREIKKDL